MLGSEIPSELTAPIYRAAVDDDGWAAFCDALHRHTGAPVKMFGHAVETRESLGLIGAGWDPHELGRYHAYYGAINPWMHMNLALPAGTVGVSDEALPREDLIKTEFYNDWLRPQENILGGPAMICYRSARRFVALVAACRARDMDGALPGLVGLLERLSPLITQSIAVSSGLRAGGGSEYRHLQASRHAIVLLRRSGRIAFANQAAEAFMAKAAVLCCRPDGRLYAKDEALRGLIERALDGSAAAVEPPPPVKVDTEVFGRCVVFLHPLPDEAATAFPSVAWSDPAVALLAITGRFGPEETGIEALVQQAFGATAAEAALGAAVVAGLSLYDYADRQGLSRHTVRNQMRSLLLKSGAHNQARFVAMVLRLQSPFLPPMS